MNRMDEFYGHSFMGLELLIKIVRINQVEKIKSQFHISVSITHLVLMLKLNSCSDILVRRLSLVMFACFLMQCRKLSSVYMFRLDEFCWMFLFSIQLGYSRLVVHKNGNIGT